MLVIHAHEVHTQEHNDLFAQLFCYLSTCEQVVRASQPHHVSCGYKMMMISVAFRVWEKKIVSRRKKMISLFLKKRMSF